MPHPDTAKQDEITRARARDAQLRWQTINRQKREIKQEQLRFAQDADAPSLSPDRVSPYSALNSPSLDPGRRSPQSVAQDILQRGKLDTYQDVDGPPLDYFERPTGRELMRTVGAHGSGGELSQDERDRSSEVQRNAYAALAADRTRDTQMRRQALGMSRLPRDVAPPPENEWLMEYGPNSTFDRNPDAGLVPQARENAARTLSEIRLTPEQQLYNTIFGSPEAHAQMSREEANDKGAVYKVLLDAQERHRASVAEMDAEELNDLIAENAWLTAKKENDELKELSNPNPLEAKEESNAERARAFEAYYNDPNTVQPGMESFTSAGNSLLFDEQEGRSWGDLARGAYDGVSAGGIPGMFGGMAKAGREDVDTVAEAQEWLRDNSGAAGTIDDTMRELHDQRVSWGEAVNYLNIQAGAAGDDPKIPAGIVQAVVGRWEPVFYDRDRSVRQYMGEPEPVRQLPFGFSR